MKKKMYVRARLVTAAAICAGVLCAVGIGASTASVLPKGIPNENPALAAVYKAIKGLSPAKAQAKLIQLAHEEGSTVTVYTAGSTTSLGAVDPVFTQLTGVNVNVSIVTSVAALEKISAEQEAGTPMADVVGLSEDDAYTAAKENLLAPLNSPVASQEEKGTVFPDWAGFSTTPYALSWNTSLITTPPTNFVSALKEYKGSFGFSSTDWFWFGTVVQWLEKTQHMTQAQAISLFTDAATGSRFFSGQSTILGALETGAVKISADLTTSEGQIAVNAGAPVAYRPAVPPIVVLLAGLGIVKDAPHPAAALLYLDFRITQGEKIFFDTLGATGTDKAETPSIEQYLHVPAKDVISIPQSIAFTGRLKWQALYQNLINAG